MSISGTRSTSSVSHQYQPSQILPDVSSWTLNSGQGCWVVSHADVPNSWRDKSRSSSIVSTISFITSPSANAYTKDRPIAMPSSSCACRIWSSTCFSKVFRAVLADGRNCGRGCRARNTCSHAKRDTQIHETYF